MQQKPTVFVVDDDLSLLDSISDLLRSIGLTVECFSSVVEFLARAATSPAGCLVLDMWMPGMNGAELQERLIADRIELPVIMITGRGNVPMCVSILKRGAVDFLEKPFAPGLLVKSVREALDLDARRREHRACRAEAEARLEQLSHQERQVLQLTVAGLTTEDIAFRMDVSRRTVHSRRSSLMKKLNVTSRSQLIQTVLPCTQSRIGSLTRKSVTSQCGAARALLGVSAG